MNVIIFFFSLLQVVIIAAETDAPAEVPRNCASFGNTFHLIQSNNVEKNCKLPNGKRICCAAMMNHTIAEGPDGGFFGVAMSEKGVGLTYHPSHDKTMPITAHMNKPMRTVCHIHKKYISSPWELQQLATAEAIDTMPKQNPAAIIDRRRRKALLDYVRSVDYNQNATIWLQRIQVHMQEPVIEATADDYEFLSRFEVTRTCAGEKHKEQWNEWIEPLTITARHPFGYDYCYQYVDKEYLKSTGFQPRTRANDVDYVLLQSGAALYNQTHTSNGRRIHQTTFSYGDEIQFSAMKRSGSQVKNEQQLERLRQKMLINSGPPKHFLFDAGTSTFDSSLVWFTCGYSQRKVAFDQVYGWEMTLLEPKDYWRRVPSNWKPYWHFYNIPVVSDMKEADSPVRYIKQMATERDFVSFKLDIDHSETEMPLAMGLFNNPEVSKLIDEFFFELHFRCEVMMKCGWSPELPYESHGLILDRTHVLQFFLDLRKRGIRAHSWP